MCGSISAEIRKGNWHTQSVLFRMTPIYVRSFYSSLNVIICIMQLFIVQVLILRCMAWENWIILWLMETNDAIGSHKSMKKNNFGTVKKWCYREFDVIRMTLYGVLFYKDKEREKSGPTKNWCYSEFDVIGSDVIGSFDCMHLF